MDSLLEDGAIQNTIEPIIALYSEALSILILSTGAANSFWNSHSVVILVLILIFSPRCPPLANFWARRRERLRSVEMARFEPGADRVHPLIWMGSALIFAAVGALFAWASTFEIEINAQAQGQVQPTGRVAQIQSSVGGVVGRIHVQNGDHVSPAAPLITLDDEDAFAQLASVQAELATRTGEALRLRASLESDPLPTFDQFVSASSLPPQVTALERAVLEENLRKKDADAALQNGAVVQRQSQIEEEQTRIRRYESRIRLVRRRVDAQKKLFERQATTLTRLSEVEEELHELETRRLVARKVIQTRSAEIDVIEGQKTQQEAEFRSVAVERLSEISSTIQSLHEEQKILLNKIDRHQVRAPESGIVQELAVNAIGGVVNTDEVLLKLVPSERPLEVRVIVSNADVGFVTEGQPVNVKLEAYDFTRYGILRGVVEQISNDAVTDPVFGEGFDARIAITANELRGLEEEARRLTPGMRVTVDIETGRRTLLSFIAAPITRSLQESVTIR